ncbi:MAG: hypothetical protein MJZ98_01585 [Paludibacteraceae bacterium]|nr:hypothetical protein [Paludibacteraceae bacterium]
MTTKRFFAFALCAAVLGTAPVEMAAKKKKDKTEAPVETVKEVDMEQCNINMSLFYESAKNKNYVDALAPWQEVYRDCPQLSKAIYTYGSRILCWQIEQEADAAKKEALIDQLMKLYDDQVKYFGNDAKTPAPAVMAWKAHYALVYRPEQTDAPYAWLKESVSKLDLASEPSFLQNFVSTSFKRYKAGTGDVETFINDYMEAVRICDAVSKDPANTKAEEYASLRQGLDALFVQSGAADCEGLEKIYKEKVEEHKADLDYLKTVIRFFKRLRCSESDVFFAASKYAHAISPTYESANGLAAMYYKDGAYSKAISMFEEAAKLATDKEDKADAYFKIAQIYTNNMKSYSSGYQYAQKTLEFEPNNGQAYIIIAICYSGATVSDDPILNRSRYWVAVDMLQKAKSVDPSCADAANKLIGSYMANFPKKDEIFMHPELKIGGSYTVGGWIGRTTTVRARN